MSNNKAFKIGDRVKHYTINVYGEVVGKSKDGYNLVKWEDDNNPYSQADCTLVLVSKLHKVLE